MQEQFDQLFKMESNLIGECIMEAYPQIGFSHKLVVQKYDGKKRDILVKSY